MMRILAKPIRSSNPRNMQLYSYMASNCHAEVDEFAISKLFFERYDILHVHWPDRVFYWNVPKVVAILILNVVFYVARKRKMKIVYTCHNIFPRVKLGRKTKRAYYYTMRKYLDGVVCPRGDAALRVQKLYCHSSVSVVPLGIIDVEPVHDSEFYKEVIEDNGINRYILIPGLQDSTKKVEVVVDRLLEYSKKTNKAILVAGKFSDKEYYKILKKRYESFGHVFILDMYLEEGQLTTLVSKSEFIIASQVGGFNSGVVTLALALSKQCFCASSALARSASLQYNTNLVKPLSEVYSFDGGGGGHKIVFDRKFSMESVSRCTYKFYESILQPKLSS